MKITVPWVPSLGSQRPAPLRLPLLRKAHHHLHRPVDRRNQIHLDEQAEGIDRIDHRFAGDLVHLHRQLVPVHTRGRHADPWHTVLGAEQVEGPAAELLVGRVADQRFGDGCVQAIVDHPGHAEDALVAVNQGHRAGPPLRQLDRDSLPDPVARTGHDGTFPMNLHRLISPARRRDADERAVVVAGHAAGIPGDLGAYCQPAGTGSPGGSVGSGRRTTAAGTSTATATASPPPMQRLAMPRRPPVRFRAVSRVTRIRAPLHPIGCPSATAPPKTLSFSGAMASSRWAYRATTAKASLIS